MIKKMITKKILIATLALISLTLFCVFKDDSSNLNIKEQIEYVNNELLTHDIFLLDSNNYLAITKVAVENKEIESLARELLEILIIDGKGEAKIPNGFRSIIPSNTEILNVLYEESVLKVDLSKEFLDVNISMEEKVLESIIFTLTSIEYVEKVIIYKDGEILTNLPQSKKILPSIFDRSYGINKKYDINNIKDIIGVTVYYINEYNDNYYYVPVTNYLNDQREKISIIIDELSNNFLYTDSLMSFLNPNVRLENSKIEGDVMTLNFNNAIFNSISDKDILEEVIYTISLSVLDNYDVKEVSFNVENEQIYKKGIEY